MHFIYSSDLFLLKKHLDKIIKNISKDKKCEIIEHSFIEDSLQDIKNTLITFSMFEDFKIIILKESWFVNESKVQLHKDFNNETLISMLSKIAPNTEVIFTLNSDKFSKKLKIANFIKYNFEIYKIEKLSEQTTFNYINEFFKRNNKIIENETISYIVNNLPNDMQVISNELNKFINIPENEITLKIVAENLNKYFDVDIFELSNHFINNDLTGFLNKFKDFSIINNDLTGFLSLLNTNLSFTRNLIILKNQGVSDQEIAKKLNTTPYRIKMTLKFIKADINNLNDKIILLYNLNKKMMQGKSDNKIIPEYEFLKVMKG
ncbi:DNA polymerase III subunit delta [Williamsoniiplasma somnilux]|uniref:DNA polymerase III subunit delta n=1 Tax=Williamsoniiplasma somnilux TaxID=215578 RepID=A0A2K8NY58_9MOLU|nr:hypothetical protein [Williamsoniiplasma somnilux]ATZ18765.1 DNA polymerase III subunit delta [Williamsoniiplasma somnilux]